MKRLLLLPILLSLAAPALAGGGPENVLVVVNGRDPDSVRIGEHYLEAREVPRRNLVTLDLPVGLTTDLATYKARIEEPIKDHMAKEGIAGHIDYLVLTRGLPILVRIPGKPASTAACLVAMDTPITGRPNRSVPMPGDGFQNPWREVGKRFSHADALGDQGIHLYLVTFLTGYTAGDSIALVDRAVQAEKSPPTSPVFHFQDANGNAAGRNSGYAQAIQRLKEKGFEAHHHTSGADKVKGMKDIMGWMSGGSYSGLTEDGIASNTFLPGAIADMLESFGAVPKNFDPGKKSQVPVTWFVRHGITGVHGAVAEPYAHTFPDVLLFERYVSGMNLAEAFHSSLPFLYWMNLVIGDPLCTPFAKRPEVEVRGVPSAGTVSGPVTLEVASEEGVREITLYVDGLRMGSVRGTEGEIVLDTTRLADGPHRLLAAAIRDDDLETQGWRSAPLMVRNTAPAPIAAGAAADGAIRVTLSAPLPAKAAADVTATVGGTRAEARPSADGRSVLVVPGASLTGKEVDVALAGDAKGSIAFVPPPAAFRVEVPAEVAAGEKVALRATAVDAAGNPVPAFTGRISVTLSDPPITGAEVSTEKPVFRGPFSLEKAGELEIRVRDRISGAEGTAKVRVTPGPVAKCQASPGTIPQGEPADLTVTLLDRFGNRVDYDGELSLQMVSDSRAEVPGPATAKGGRAVFRGVVAWRRGQQPFFVRDADGNRLKGTPVRVEPFSIRTWLVRGPVPGKIEEVAESVAARGPSEGRIEGGKLWRRIRSRRGDVDLAGELGGSGKGLDFAHVWVHVPEDVRVSLRLGWRPRVVLFVDGREIHRAAKAVKKVKPDQEVVPQFPLHAGWHRVLVVAERSGRGGAFSFRISDGEGNAVPGLRTALSDPEGGRRLAGRVRAGGKGLAGVEVAVSGPADLVTRTAGDGSFAVGGLPPGKYRVRPKVEGLDATPSSREADLTGSDAGSLDFEVRDDVPPKVSIASPENGAKVGSKLEVVVEATDNAGVAKVIVLVDGRPAGPELARPPFRAVLDTAPFGTGTVHVAAVAVDGAGNRTESKAIRVKVVEDRAPPRIRILKPRRGRTLKGKTKLKASVADDLGVAEVVFLLDGKPVGKPLTDEPFEVPFDAGAAKAGTHTLTVRATDREGKTAEESVKFRTR